MREAKLVHVAMIVWNEFRNDARVLKEAETLQQNGLAVTVYALHTPGLTLESEVLDSGIRVTRVARNPFWKWRKNIAARKIAASKPSVLQGPIGKLSARAKISRIIARLFTHFLLMVKMTKMRPDIVHAHDVNTLPTAWLVAALTRAKLVYDAHEISTGREGYASFRTLVAMVERLVIPRAAATITTTDARAKFFSRAYGVERPIVLQNRPRYQPRFTSRRLREELALEKPWPIILYQGGLQQGRGLETLVSAAANVEGAYLVFIGGGRLEKILHDLAARLNIRDRVFFIPTVSLSNLPSYTASADIGVQPIENTCLNHFTTDSNKLFEYVIAGLSLVTSDLPEIRKVVRENDLGLLVPPGDSRALTLALQTLVDDAQLRERYRKASLAAAKELNWEQQEHKLTELYEKIMR